MKTELYSVLQVSKILDFSPNYIRKLMSDKKLNHFRIGRSIKISSNHIDEFLSCHEIKKPQSNFNLLPPIQLLPNEIGSLNKHNIKGGFNMKTSAKKSKPKYVNLGIGSVYVKGQDRKGNDSWFIRYYDVNGIRKSEKVKGALNRDDAIAHLYQKVDAVKKEKFFGVKSKTSIKFNEFADVYIENYAKIKKKSWYCDFKYLKYVITPYFGQKLLSEITPMMIQQFRVKRLTKNEVSKKTINNETVLLKKMFSLADEWGYELHNNVNPVKKGREFKVNNKRNRELTDEEEVRLFQNIKPESSHLKPILITALETGMRKTEVMYLEWKEIDLEKRIITLSKSRTKNEHEHIVPISDHLYPTLKELHEKNQKIKSKYVFLYQRPEDGKYIHVHDVKNSFHRLLKRAEIEDLKFHDLRRTFSSRLIRSGVSDFVVKNLLNHKMNDVTDRYVVITIQDKFNAVNKLRMEPEQTNNQPISMENLVLYWYQNDPQKFISTINDLFLEENRW